MALRVIDQEGGICECGALAVKVLVDEDSGKKVSVCNVCSRRKLEEYREENEAKKQKSTKNPKCSICRTRPHVRKSPKGPFFCRSCLQAYCFHCKKELSADELRLPAQEAGNGLPARLCLACFEQEMLEARNAAIARAKAKYKNNKSKLICTGCGRINDSWQGQELANRYCRSCREARGATLELKETRPDINEGASVGFDRFGAGIPDRKNK